MSMWLSIVTGLVGLGFLGIHLIMPLTSNNSPLAVLSQADTRMLSISIVASTLSFLDFLLFVYLADIIASVFFPEGIDPWLADIQVAGVFAAGYLARPLGGVLLGRYGDKVGRKAALSLSVFMLTVFTLCIGVLPSYAQIGVLAPLLLLLARIGQGMAFGGQVPSTWVFIGETLPSRYLSLGCSYIVAAYLASVLCAEILFAVMNNLLTPSDLLAWGWRMPLVITGMLSIWCVLLLRNLDETPVFTHLRQQQQLITQGTIRFLARHQYHALFVCMMLTWFTASMMMVIVLLLPDLIAIAFLLPEDYMVIANGLGIWFMMLGCIFYGFLADRMNAGLLLIIGSLILSVQIFVFYYHLEAGGDFILVLYALLGFSAGIIGMVPAIMVRLFHASVRLTGMAFSYNLVYAVVGGILPFVLGYATALVTMAPALYVTFMCLIAMIMGLYVYRLPSIVSTETIASFEIDDNSHGNDLQPNSDIKQH